MSRKLLAFLLSELKTVRVICKRDGCGMIYELPVAELETRFKNMTCPACKNLLGHGNENGFAWLSAAVRAFATVKDWVELEFVLKDDG
jgi:hypothetical protein